MRDERLQVKGSIRLLKTNHSRKESMTLHEGREVTSSG